VTGDVEDAVAEAFRAEWGRVVASLIRSFGDWDLAEECAQDAFARALERWPDEGIPRKPGAWLTTTARHRAVDRIRRAATGEAKLREVGMRLGDHDGFDQDDFDQDGFNLDSSGIEDDRLRLLFTCCHPALSLEAQVALTLRTLAGLTTAEIARALLVSEPTMAKRLVRAKHKITDAAIPYRVPTGSLLPERTAGVLGVLYLLFNEGYGATAGGSLLRADLCEEAIRLARLLVELMPDEPEARGLLALMLLQHARREARTNSEGDLIPLDEQDRSRWSDLEIAEGLGVLAGAERFGRPGSYGLQARIAACHATARTAEATDWAAIESHYRELAAMTGSPVVALNHAVAVAMSEGPAAGLVLVDELDESGALAGYHLLTATRADLLRRLGRFDEAAAAYSEAIAAAGTEPERRYLTRRLGEVSAADPAR
jgi:RNA polymerase sigma-70 factor (ECF subfamily)